MKQEEQSASIDQEPNWQASIRHYLLDEMDQKERTSFEDALLASPDLFEEIAAEEDDLIMRYLRGDLEPRVTLRFAEVYMTSPPKRARVEAARRFQQAVLNSSRSKRHGMLRNPRFAVAMSLGATLMLVAGFWFVRRMATAPPKPIPLLSTYTVVLEPGLTRSSGGVQIALPAATRQVRLELITADSTLYGNYLVTLDTAERPAAWSGLASLKDGRVIAMLPATVLPAGDYVLKLQADSNELAIYYFRVTK